MAERGTVVVFVRMPVAGRTKTRLARGIGAFAAAALYRRVAAKAIAGLARGPWRVVLAVTPAAGLADPWLRGFGLRLVAQSGGDLGRRMREGLRAHLRGPVLVVGSDVPELSPADVRAAFRALAGAEAVFGPAEDGGYWLVGFGRRKPLQRLFAGVRWSSPHALADSRATLPRTLRVARLRMLRDLDAPEDLQALGGRDRLVRRISAR